MRQLSTTIEMYVLKTSHGSEHSDASGCNAAKETRHFSENCAVGRNVNQVKL